MRAGSGKDVFNRGRIIVHRGLLIFKPKSEKKTKQQVPSHHRGKNAIAVTAYEL